MPLPFLSLLFTHLRGREILGIRTASARSGSIFGNGQMLVVRALESCADSLGQLVSREQPVGLYHLALAMDPLGLHRIEPRALFGQQAAYDPHSRASLFDLTVVSSNPPSHLAAYVPAGVVPDQHPNSLADRFELLRTPRKEAGSYLAHRATIHKAQPHLIELRHIKPVAGDGFGIRVVFSNRLLHQAQRLPLLAPAMQRGQSQPTPPTLVTETHSPGGVGMIGRHPHQSVASPFFLAYSGSGLVIQRLARSQRTPNRAKVARMVSPVTCSSVSPSSKLTSAAISKVQRLLCLPNLRGSW